MRNEKPLILAVVLIAAVGAAFSLGLNPWRISILPGAEGLAFGVYGFSPAGSEQCYSTADTLPAPYEWIDRTPYNPIVEKLSDQQKGQVAVEVGTPSHGDPVRTVTYYVKTGENDTAVTYTKVVGNIVPYYVTMQVYTPPRSGTLNFAGEKLWFSALTVKWNRAMADPDNPAKSSYAAYSVPLGVWIDGYELLGFYDANGNLMKPTIEMQTHSQLTPSLRGRWLPLYSEPSTVTTIGDLYQSPDTVAATLNQSLAGNPLPDTRFEPQVYFPITLGSFGTYSEGIWILGTYKEYYPSVEYQFKVLYLELGEFTYTIDKEVNQTLPGWDPRNSTAPPNWWDSTWGVWWYNFVSGINSWFTNPFNTVMLGAVILATALIVIVAFLTQTRTGKAVDAAAGKALKGKKKGGKRK